MLRQLQGRNLAHVGCFFGLVLGLSVGIVLAGILAARNVAIAIALFSWLGLTVVLAGIGYVAGSRWHLNDSEGNA
jgi:hypothetical protein